MYFKISWDVEFCDLMMHLYAKYGRELFTIDGIGDQMDMNYFAKKFFSSSIETTSDISVDANANVTRKSVIEYDFEFSKPFKRYNSYFLLWKQLNKNFGMSIANQTIEKQLTGEIYVNDFNDLGKPYCFNFSTYDIALNGLDMSSRMKIYPANSLDIFLRQVEQFIVFAANSTLGATGIADVLIVASHYVDRIIETGCDGGVEIVNVEKYVHRKLKSFIYTLNWEFRGNQSPFTNLSVYDDYFLESIAPDYSLGGKSPNISTIRLVQKLYLDAMNTELTRSPLTFPVTTACLSKVTKDESENPESKWFGKKVNSIKDKGFRHFIAKMNMDFGFINIYYGDTATLSSCCRLRSSKENEYFNTFGAGSSKIGSIGVVTNNLPKLARKAGGDSKVFLELVKDSVQTTAYINHAKRKLIQKRIDVNTMPLYTLGHMSTMKQYSTYGVNGLYEALQTLGYDILTEEGQNFVFDILRIINDNNDKYSKVFGSPHNCEQTPSENSAIKLVAKDRYLEGNIDYDIYSNQFIPLTSETDILNRLRLQGMFDGEFSGGAICHLSLGEPIENVETMEKIMDYAAECGVVYWAVNYSIKKCSSGHLWLNGESCPVCGKEVDSIVTRVVGFFTEVKNWNKVRREKDHPNRQQYGGVDEYCEDGLFS